MEVKTEVYAKRGVSNPAVAPTADDAAGEPVGRLIRELRRSRGMTLNEVAGIVGCSVGYLSQLERGISPITLDVLGRIARVMDVSISWFFSPATAEAGPESDFVVRRANRRKINLSRAGVREELLSPHLDRALEMVLTTFEPGAGTGEEGRTRKGEEGGLVLSGQLELRIDGQTFLLEAGDSFQMGGTGRHWCRNPGTVEAVILWSFGATNF